MSNPITINVTMSPLPTNFRGTPQKLAEAIVERLHLVTDNGYATFVVSDSLPTTDQGPVFLGGTRIYVWDPDQSKYVPQDITDSFTPAFVVSETEPDPPDDSLNPNPPVWLKIKGTRLIGWYFYMGVINTVDYGWVPMSGVTPSGPTASRPNLPHEFERYYDTDLSIEIWYERGAWRTTSGVKGDIKFVTHETLAEAIAANPGWVEVGSIGTNLGQGARGRVLVPAHKDFGPDPSSNFTPLEDITARAAREEFGEELHELTGDENGEHQHTLVNDVTSSFITTEDMPDPTKTINRRDTDSYTLQSSAAAENPARNGLSSVSGLGAGHNTIQPSLALWCLVKT